MVTGLAAEGDWWELRPGQQPSTAALGSVQRKMLEYLGQHSDTAFTTPELAAHLGTGAYNRARGLIARGYARITTPVGAGRTRHIQITPAGIAHLHATQHKAEQ